jgi:hypothetical protein
MSAESTNGYCNYAVSHSDTTTRQYQWTPCDPPMSPPLNENAGPASLFSPLQKPRPGDWSGPLRT